ncbi:unnamed protein product [Sphagnum balticum]
MRDSERLALLADMPRVDGLAVCPFLKITDARRDITSWWGRTTPYVRDGLLLATDESYWTQKCLKWKTDENSTFDFLVIRCPEWLEGKYPFVKNEEGDTLYILNVGVASDIVPQKQHGFPMKRADERVLHGEICELVRDRDSKTWQLKRVRKDKPSILRGGTEIGNDIKTALDIWSKQKYPFPIEYLYAPPVERDTGFESLRPAVVAVVSDLLDEETVTSAISHFVPFGVFTANVPYKAVLVPAADAWPNYHQEKAAVTHIPYTHIGKIVLPKDFIGGAQLVVTMDPELLGHVSCISKTVASGGRLVVVCRFNGTETSDTHPLVSRAALMKDIERSGFTLEHDYGMPETEGWETVSKRFDAWSILCFRKENRGASEMKIAEVHKENPHLRGNKDANFVFKFARQKTKDISCSMGTGVMESCSALEIDAIKGELLIDIEFLVTLDPKTQLLYFGTQRARLSALFHEVKWLTEQDANPGNVEALISHLDYAASEIHVERYEPHAALINFDHHDLARGRVFKGKCFLIPFFGSYIVTCGVDDGTNARQVEYCE